MSEFIDWWFTKFEMERAIRTVFADHNVCQPGDNNNSERWNEDYITKDLLKAIRHVLNSPETIDIPGVGDRARIHATAFKQTGLPETRTGDVAVIVRFSFPGNKIYEGVGFLEAKKRDWNGNGFSGVKASKRPAQQERTTSKQFKSILSYAPHAYLLLYDQSPVVGTLEQAFANHHIARRWKSPLPLDVLSDLCAVGGPECLRQFINIELAQHEVRDHGWFYAGNTSHAIVVPLSMAATMRPVAEEYYRFARPLASQICERYLLGQDLSSDEKHLRYATGRLDGAPTFVLAISVSVGDDPAPLDAGTQVNGSRFTDLDLLREDDDGGSRR